MIKLGNLDLVRKEALIEHEPKPKGSGRAKADWNDWWCAYSADDKQETIESMAQTHHFLNNPRQVDLETEKPPTEEKNLLLKPSQEEEVTQTKLSSNSEKHTTGIIYLESPKPPEVPSSKAADKPIINSKNYFLKKLVDFFKF